MVDKGLRIKSSSRLNFNYGKNMLYLKTKIYNHRKEKRDNTAAKDFSVEFASRTVLLADKF